MCRGERKLHTKHTKERKGEVLTVGVGKVKNDHCLQQQLKGNLRGKLEWGGYR